MLSMSRSPKLLDACLIRQFHRCLKALVVEVAVAKSRLPERWVLHAEIEEGPVVFPIVGKKGIGIGEQLLFD